jgi:hypothetical protein
VEPQSLVAATVESCKVWSQRPWSDGVSWFEVVEEKENKSAPNASAHREHGMQRRDQHIDHFFTRDLSLSLFVLSYPRHLSRLNP